MAERGPEVEIFADVAALLRAEAERLVAQARAAIDERGRFLLALSGGETPRPLYELLATPAFAARVDWPRVRVFFGDERCVPPGDRDSNYRMAREALLGRVPIPDENVHRIRGEDEPRRAAEAYEAVLRRELGAADDGAPARGFDVTLLGLGSDGHTASLFPGTAALVERRRWVVENHVPGARESWRITLTPLLLNASREVAFLVAGEGKAAPLAAVLEGPADRAPPARLVRPVDGTLRFLVDAAAAGALRRRR